MSLSFVSSAVLKSTDGVSHNEETPIETPQVLEVQRKQQQQQAKPLYEQLRSNQDEEEAARQEFQRSIMRGTRALDEEDVAHLDAIAKQRQDREHQYQQELQQELHLFRAARAAASTGTTSVVDDDDIDESKNGDRQDNNNDKTLENVDYETNDSKATRSTEKAIIMPKIIVKKRRRRVDENDTTSSVIQVKTKQKTEDESTNQPQLIAQASCDKNSSVAGNSLATLLGGYSSSEEDS